MNFLPPRKGPKALALREQKEREIDEFLAMIKTEVMREHAKYNISREVTTRTRKSFGVSEPLAARTVTFKIEIS